MSFLEKKASSGYNCSWGNFVQGKDINGIIYARRGTETQG